MRHVKPRLFTMMLLEYAVWGAWAAVAGKYFIDPPPHGLGFSGAYSGVVFSLLPLGAIVSPLLFGQLADRIVNAEKLQAALCLVGAGFLFALGEARNGTQVFWLMLGYSFLFAPTVTLTNAIAFAHLKDPAREFGAVRVGGTFGWFLALAALAGWRAAAGGPVPGDLFHLAGAFCLVLALFSLALPPTPPAHSARGALAFLEAIQLFRDRNFLLFFVLCLVLGAQLDFYYIFGSAFLGAPRELGGVGVSPGDLPLLMMVPPISELFVMGALGWMLPKLGIKRALVVGFAAWIVRFGCFASGNTMAAAVVGLAVHGVCFTFVFAVASLYVNAIAPPTIRASAQALVTLSLVGIGRFVGAYLAGGVSTLVASPLEPPMRVGGTEIAQRMDWTTLFAVPAVVTVLATAVLLVWFREPKT